MSNTKDLVVRRGQLMLKEGYAYENRTGDIYEADDSIKVRLENIAKYITKQTGTTYNIHYGEEKIYDTYNGEECIMLIPDNYNVVNCGATSVEDSDDYDFYAIDANGKDVFDSNIVFLWSFDLEVDNKGYFVHADGIKNGVLCMDMLEKKYGYSDEEIKEMQNC